MPPKAKKQKKKTTKVEKAKAVAVTKKGGAQAQVQNVVVKVGETKKPAKRRRRRPPAKKGEDKVTPPRPTPPYFDGYYPPQNLTRNGSFPYQISPPVLASSGSASSFVAGAAIAPSTFVPTEPPVEPPVEPEIQSGYETSFAPEAEGGFNVTEFLRQARTPKERPSYILTEEEERSFAPPVAEPPTFAEPVAAPPALVEPVKKKRPPLIIEEDEEQLAVPEEERPQPTPKKSGAKVELLNQVMGGIKTLEIEGRVPQRGARKTALIKEIFGNEWVEGKQIKDYNVYQLRLARDALRSIYNI